METDRPGSSKDPLTRGSHSFGLKGLSYTCTPSLCLGIHPGFKILAPVTQIVYLDFFFFFCNNLAVQIASPDSNFVNVKTWSILQAMFNQLTESYSLPVLKPITSGLLINCG